MDDSERFKLLHGPYAPPPLRRGDKVDCEYMGREVVVGRMSNGRIQWPLRRGRGNPGPIVCGDLIRAILTESAIAIQHWWSVSEDLVVRWRKSLGVGRPLGRMTEGSTRLSREWIPEKLTAEARRTGAAAIKDPEVQERRATKIRGVPKSLEAREKISRAHSGKKKPKEDYEARWPPELDAQLGKVHDRVVSEQTGKSISSIHERRKLLGILALGRHSKGSDTKHAEE